MDANLIQKLSSLVVDQLPEFLRVNISDPTSSSQYETFVAFLQAYYEFLEQNGEAQYVLQNSRSYKDIDDTIDDFVDKFLQEFAYDLPKTIFTDQNLEDGRIAFGGLDQIESKRAIAKRIGALYATKGSEAAIRLLFRLLFDEEVLFYYPKEDMLRASDGRWTERITLKIHDEAGNIDYSDLGGNLVVSTSGSEAVIDRVITVGSQSNLYIYELELERGTISGNFAPNETVSFYRGNLENGALELINQGSVTGVISNVDINTRGYGYTVGDALIVSGDGAEYFAQVAAVNGGGKILRISVDNFGANYTAITSITTAAPTQTKIGKYEFSGNTVTGNGIVTVYTATDHGLVANDIANITIANSTQNYSILQKASSKKFRFAISNLFVTSGNLVLNPQYANLSANIGALCTYYGYKTGEEGETNERIKIQDSYYYQDYSYVIRTTQQSAYWRELVKKILHPAGMELFGEVYVSTAEGGTETVSVAPTADVYSVIVLLLKIIETALVTRVSVETAVQLLLNSRASRTLEKYAIGPSYRTLEQYKFEYNDMHIYDIGSLVINNVVNQINDPSPFPPPNYVKKANSNIVLNSTFSTDTQWTKGTGWTISSSNAVATAASSNLNQLTSINAVNEKTYYCQYVIRSVSAGSMRVTLQANGYSNTSPIRSSVGTYSDYFLLTSNNTLANANLIITGTGFTGNVSNVVLRPMDFVTG
jgi:hypothetical protein